MDESEILYLLNENRENEFNLIERAIRTNDLTMFDTILNFLKTRYRHKCFHNDGRCRTLMEHAIYFGIEHDHLNNTLLDKIRFKCDKCTIRNYYNLSIQQRRLNCIFNILKTCCKYDRVSIFEYFVLRFGFDTEFINKHRFACSFGFFHCFKQLPQVFLYTAAVNYSNSMVHTLLNQYKITANCHCFTNLNDIQMKLIINSYQWYDLDFLKTHYITFKPFKRHKIIPRLEKDLNDIHELLLKFISWDNIRIIFSYI